MGLAVPGVRFDVDRVTFISFKSAMVAQGCLIRISISNDVLAARDAQPLRSLGFRRFDEVY
ncbi:hypothetical protein THIOKS11960002 [Thiocapsa sp. KS1]|nr:hypothetical protein THIOKS11960002 [Thiocapsa sp. KS1]